MVTKRFRMACAELFASIYLEDGLACVSDTKARRYAFERFCRDAAPDIAAMSRWIHLKWHLPAEAEASDLQQCAMMSVWRIMCRFDISRGTSFHDFIYINSFSETKRWAHKVRGASIHGSADARKSRHPTYIDDMTARKERLPPALVTEPNECTFDASRAESLVMKAIRTEREYHAYVAWRDAEGVIEQAAETIVSDPQLRRKLNLWSEVEARRAIMQTVRALTERIQESV